MGNRRFMGTGGTGRTRLAALAASFVMALAGGMVSTSVSAQIAGTKHNLGTTTASGNNRFSATAEICVFCHTPHGADTSAAVPLWNRTLVGQTYQTYDSLGTSSLDGKVAPVGSVSIACLSCHDGVQSMSAVINAPGSGLSSAAWTSGAWTGTNQTAGVMTGVAALGIDLRNDHPIGIQYGGGGYNTVATAGPSTDPDFKGAASALIGVGPTQTRVWWVDTEAAPDGLRQKTDLPLYTRGTGGTNVGYTGQTLPEPFVECASCHDPHTQNPTFLRIQNTGSAVCLACHTK